MQAMFNEDGANATMTDDKDVFKLDSDTSSNIVASQLTAYHELQNSARNIVRITIAVISLVIAAIGSGVLQLSELGIPEQDQFEAPFEVSTDLISLTITVSILIAILLTILGTYTIAYAYADLLKLLKPRKLKPIFSSESEPYEVTRSTSKDNLSSILNNNNEILNEMQSSISAAYNSFLITFIIGSFISLVAISINTGDVTPVVYVLVFPFWTIFALFTIYAGRAILAAGRSAISHIRATDAHLKRGYGDAAYSYIVNKTKNRLSYTYHKAADLNVHNAVLAISGIASLLVFPLVGLVSWNWTSAFLENVISSLT